MFLHKSQRDWNYSFNRAFMYMIIFHNNVHNGVDVVHCPDFQPWTLLWICRALGDWWYDHSKQERELRA
jgi:hypothetical protein